MQLWKVNFGKIVIKPRKVLVLNSTKNSAYTVSTVHILYSHAREVKMPTFKK